MRSVHGDTVMEPKAVFCSASPDPHEVELLASATRCGGTPKNRQMSCTVMRFESSHCMSSGEMLIALSVAPPRSTPTDPAFAPPCVCFHAVAIMRARSCTSSSVPPSASAGTSMTAGGTPRLDITWRPISWAVRPPAMTSRA
jgi:hypothetical protein